jgi:transketolase
VLGIEPIEAKWQAFGWSAWRVDGNDVPALLAAFDAAREAEGDAPRVIVCDTRIGRGVPLLEEREKAHFMRIAEDEWPICREQLERGRTR